MDQHREMERAFGVRLNISALTLNPMGKRRCLEFEDYAGGYAAKAKCRNRTNRLLHSPSVVWVSARIHCGPTVFSAKTSLPERSMEFIGFYIFKCHHGDEIRLKHYAGILVIEF